MFVYSSDILPESTVHCFDFVEVIQFQSVFGESFIDIIEPLALFYQLNILSSLFCVLVIQASMDLGIFLQQFVLFSNQLIVHVFESVHENLIRISDLILKDSKIIYCLFRIVGLSHKNNVKIIKMNELTRFLKTFSF